MRNNKGKSTRGLARTAIAVSLGIFIAAAVIFWTYRAAPAVLSSAPALAPVSSISYRHPNHIHGLGYDGVHQRLFVATHHGLFIWKEGLLFQLGKSRDDYMGFSLHPSDPNIVYASGHPEGGGNMGVMKSEDGGASFRRIFGGLKGEAVDFHSMAVSAANPEVLYGWFQGRIYRTKDGGASWKIAAARGLSGQGFCFGAPCLAADSRDERLLFAGTADGLFVSRDFGESWSAVNREGAFAGVAVAPRGAPAMVAFTQPRGVAVSLDEGKSWQARNAGITLASGEVVFAFAFDPKDSKRVFAATPERVFQSFNQGATWKKIL